MKINFSSTSSDPAFVKLKDLLSPMIKGVLAGEKEHTKKAILLMLEFAKEMPVSFSKSQDHTQQIFREVGRYLHTDNLEILESIARKRKTDRLPMDHAIACDALEYLAFLPMQLDSDPANIHRYTENMDNILWILHREYPRTNWRKKIEAMI